MTLVELQSSHYQLINDHNRVVAVISKDIWEGVWKAHQPRTFKLLGTDERKEDLIAKIEAMDL